MPVTPCFDPTTGASGGAAPGGATPPTLSVSGRVNKGAYTVSSGARSLTISNPDAATLLTTVKLSTDGSAVTVTDSTTTSPSWTAASGGADGLAYEVTVTATKSGATAQVSFTEAVNSTGLLAMTPTQVNLTDGTWTLYDPDSQVDTVSYDAVTGLHTVTMNAGGASSDYNPGSGSVFRGARWYKLLTVAGTQVDSADWLTVEHIVDPTSTTADWVQRNFFATTTDPTSTTNHTTNSGLQLLGAAWSHPSGTEQGTCIGNSFQIAANALSETLRAVALRGNDFVGMAASLVLKSGPAFASATQRFGQYTVQTTGNVYLVVGLGIKTNTEVIVAGDQTQFRLRYVASTLDSGTF